MITDTIIQNKVASVIKLSIITPVYNASGFINNFISALLEQEFKEWEIIFLDNFSTDNSADLINRYSSIDSRITLHCEKDNGIYDAMNKGIDLAKGDWLYFMGSDDLFYDNQVLKNLFQHSLDNIDVVYGDVCWMPSGVIEKGEWTPNIFINRNINHQRIFYRKTLFEKIGNYNIQYKIAADHELNVRIFCDEKIRKQYLQIIVAKYNSEGCSARKTDEKFWQDWDQIIYRNFKDLLPRKMIFGSLGIYCRFLIDKKNYIKALKIIAKVFFNTMSFGFIWLMIKYSFQSKLKRAE